MKLGEKIIALRNDKGMTRRDLAKSLGVAYPTLANYEIGIRKPDSEMLCVIADFFQVSLDELVGREFKKEK